jgi:hypothetical protein
MSSCANSSLAPATTPATEAIAKATATHQRKVAAFENAQKGKAGAAWYWSVFKPEAVRNTDGQITDSKLRCEACKALLSGANPSSKSKEHLETGACKPFQNWPEWIKLCNGQIGRAATKKAMAIKRASHEVDGDDTTGKDAYASALQEFKKSKKQSDITQFTLNKEQMDQATEDLVLWFFEACSSVALHQIGHPRFVKFCQRFGYTPPSRNTLATKLLNQQYAQFMNSMMMSLTAAPFIQGVYRFLTHLLDIKKLGFFGSQQAVCLAQVAATAGKNALQQVEIPSSTTL